MRGICVCMEQLESRTLLAAGSVDPTYAPAFQNARMGDLTPRVRAQLDGKMLHLNRMGASPSSTQIWRTNPNGSLDTTFASSGVLYFGSARVADFEIQPDGKIVTLMDSLGYLDLRRFTASGAPDSSFGIGGRATAAAPIYSHFHGMALQNDGRIVIIGSDDDNGYVRRFNTGKVDTSFGTNGVVTILPTRNPTFGWVDMGGVDIRRTDNRIVVTATDNLADSREQWQVLVLAPNGALEWSGTEPMADEGSRAGNVVVDGDGSILVAGQVWSTDDSGHTIFQDVLVRYPPPNSNAPVTWIKQSDVALSVIVPQGDGRILTIEGHRVHRLNYNLTTDTSFGSFGFVATGWPLFSIALQGDGKIVVDGTSPFTSQDPDAVYRSIRFTGDSPAAKLARDGTLNLTGSTRGDRIVASSISGMVGVFDNAIGPFVFTGSSVNKVVVNAGDGNDLVTLSGRLPGAILNGGNGNDTLTGGLGNDIFNGGNNRDTVTYAGRTSALILSIDNSANDGQTGEFDNISTDIETVIGGNGNDRITGSDATNALYGGPGNDVLIGKAGNDLLGGQDGNDTMDGGVGSDGFFGNTGIDTADYSNRWDALIITQDEVANDGKAGEYDNVHNDVEVIRGGNLADKITGGNLNNILFGFAGNDTLIGGGGNDVIYGGTGNDVLTGSAGADSLFGEDGDDTLFARDGVADPLLSGGNGFDSAQVDSIDANKSGIEKYLA
jgi:uncharacterized delta-60 repeat protein